MRPPSQQQQYHLELIRNANTPCPDLQNQKLKMRPINLFAGSPGDSDIHSILRTTDVNHSSPLLGVITITAKFNKLLLWRLVPVPFLSKRINQLKEKLDTGILVLNGLYFLDMR